MVRRRDKIVPLTVMIVVAGVVRGAAVEGSPEHYLELFRSNPEVGCI